MRCIVCWAIPSTEEMGLRGRIWDVVQWWVLLECILLPSLTTRMISHLNRGKNIAPSRRWPPHPRPSAGSVESSCSKVSTKLTWGTCRALQLEDLLLCPLQNRSDGLLLKSWLRAWLTLDLCLLSISGVSCALLWPFMLRTSSHCG